MMDQETAILRWLHEYTGTENFRPGLSRLEKMITPFKDEMKRREIFIVTIGGTNGKGETSYTLAHLLKRYHITFGLWTSPHVLSIRERIQFNGQLISYEDLWIGMETCRRLLDEEKIMRPTFYEFLLMVYCWLLIKQDDEMKIQVCLLEVGLGGRLDGVNVLNADLVGITSISRDHEHILGRGYKNILREKLGITRAHIPLITALELKFCQEIVESFTKHHHIPWIDLFDHHLTFLSDNYSKRNRLLALSLFEAIGRLTNFIPSSFTLKDIRFLLESDHFDFPRMKGRSEIIMKNFRQFIFIGAHNIDGMRKLKYSLQSENLLQHIDNHSYNFDLVLLSFSKREIEEIRNLLKIVLSPPMIAAQIVVTAFEHERAIDWEILIQLQDDPEFKQVRFVKQWKDLVSSEETKQKTLLVAGSYYFIGTMQTWLPYFVD